MSTPTPIITPPPKNPTRTTLLPTGVNSISEVAKHYSTWVLAVITAGPDLYQAAASLGYLADESMPETLKWAIRGVGGVGLLVKFISQKKPA